MSRKPAKKVSKPPIQVKVTMWPQGGKQFQTAREKMLAEFDLAKQVGESRKVRAYHGLVAEQKFRDWLGSFLPQRWGVTPGYVVSQGVEDIHQLPHFDVIVYDRLASPVLWSEEAGAGGAGSKAIPCEHVRCVIEIKSRFATQPVREAIRQLRELRHLMAGVDPPGTRYPVFLPEPFFCGIVCFELRLLDADQDVLTCFKEVEPLRGFIGVAILRREAPNSSLLGRVHLLRGDPIPPINPKRLNGPSACVPLWEQNGVHYGALLTWDHLNGFSDFAFELLNRLECRFDGYVPSFHGRTWPHKARPK